MAEPDKATQADMALAYPETYAAWESCAVNLDEIKAIVRGNQP